ncbi:MAG TPA: peptide-methionine (S)-S-oxide reductase MsrA, partial [Kiloniellaceae bacterium]|nr:peptide-methionine (S)-S-oxide reductase MsrA [Kiloniellaceae bacterium]
QVCRGDSGHAEAVEVTFDPAEIAYEDLLTAFWQLHDPTTLNRQGPDFGTQYRSAIFTHSPAQASAAEASKAALQASGRLSRPVVTEILPAAPFYRAEDYHQRYFEKRGLAAACHLR